jgi:hypothetical protein
MMGRLTPVVVGQRAHGVKADNAGADEQAARAGVARETSVRCDLIGGRGDVGQVETVKAGFAVGAGHGCRALLDARLERAERLVRQAVIVLD